MQESPLISVIVPVYKVEPYLARCLESICGQTYRNLEIICVDDGSPDKSIDILNEFAARDSRIQIIRQANQGLSAARNTGISAARGDWLTFVDSDDWVETETYKTCVPHCTEEVDMVVFGVQVDNEVPEDDPLWDQKEEICKEQQQQFSVIDDGITELSDDVILRTPLTVWNKLFRASVINGHQIRFPVGRFFEDLSFTTRFFLLCRCGYFMRGTLFYHYVQRGDSITYNVLGRSLKFARELDSIRDIHTLMKELHMEHSRELLLAQLTDLLLRNALMGANADCRSRLVKEAGKLVEEVGIAHHTELDNISLVSRCLSHRFSRLFYRKHGTKREWGVFGLMLFSIQNKQGFHIGRLLGIKLWKRREK